MDKVRINIIYKDYGVISIPFPDIKSCDQFTVWYDSYLELSDDLNKILNLRMTGRKVVGIYLEYSYLSRITGELVTKQLPVKYKCDNFDFEDLRGVYTKFYQDDRNRIFEEDGIRNVRSSVMLDYISGRTSLITDTSIEISVNSYLNSGYKVKRDAYFLLKQSGYSVKINEPSSVDNQIPNGLSFMNMKSGYFNYLKQYASRGEEEMAQVMDEIQSYDFEELRDEIGNSGYDNFDTLRRNAFQNSYSSDYDDILELEGLTGRSIDELKQMVEVYREQSRSGRNR